MREGWFAVLFSWLWLTSSKDIKEDDEDASFAPSQASLPSAFADGSTAVADVLGAADFFAVLNLPKGASTIDDAALRRAYKGVARKCHPDKCTDPAAIEAFQRVQEAFEVLSDPALLALYKSCLREDASTGAWDAYRTARQHSSNCASCSSSSSAHASSSRGPTPGSRPMPSSVERARQAQASREELERQVQEMLAKSSRSRPMARRTPSLAPRPPDASTHSGSQDMAGPSARRESRPSSRGHAKHDDGRGTGMPANAAARTAHVRVTSGASCASIPTASCTSTSGLDSSSARRYTRHERTAATSRKFGFDRRSRTYAAVVV